MASVLVSPKPGNGQGGRFEAAVRRQQHRDIKMIDVLIAGPFIHSFVCLHIFISILASAIIVFYDNLSFFFFQFNALKVDQKRQKTNNSRLVGLLAFKKRNVLI